jgi:Protein of unknown function (DUF2868)
MALTEDVAAKILLIRSIEECDPGAFSEELRAEAFVAAKNADPGLGSVERYAAYLFDHLSPLYQSILQLAKIPAPWTVPACVAGFLLGLATNLLGPANQIHVVRNPVFILIAWNLLVYLALFVVFLSGKAKSAEAARYPSPQDSLERSQPLPSLQSRLAQHPSKVPWAVKYLLPSVWQFLYRMIFGAHEQKRLARVIWRFTHHWLSLAGGLVVDRWRRLLHLSSVFLATGAVAGMYFRGLFQGYRVVWDSTFIVDESAVAGLIHVLFAPSLWLSDVFGLGLRNKISISPLLTPAGDHADGWIHLFAISVVIAIVLPRLALASWQSIRLNRLSKNIAIPLDHYYGEVIEGPIRSLIEKEVEVAVDKFSSDVASFVGSKLYDDQIIPRLVRFRENGGKINDLKSELTATTESFLPQLQSYIVNVALPELQKSLSQRVGEILKSIGTDFLEIKDPNSVLNGLTISPADRPEFNISNEFSRAIGVSVGASIALAVATVSGGIGHELGIAILATVLGTTGPVGFLIGLIVGAVIAAGAWWMGKEKIADTIENISLPGAITRAALWPSRFQRLLDEARRKCQDSVRAEVKERMKVLMPKITTAILMRVRGLWRL